MYAGKGVIWFPVLFHTHVNHSSQGQLEVLNVSANQAGLKGLPGKELLELAGFLSSFPNACRGCLELWIKTKRHWAPPKGVLFTSAFQISMRLTRKWMYGGVCRELEQHLSQSCFAPCFLWLVCSQFQNKEETLAEECFDSFLLRMCIWIHLAELNEWWIESSLKTERCVFHNTSRCFARCQTAATTEAISLWVVMLWYFHAQS